jgi:hypothetical protein
LSSCNGQMINCASASASQRNMDACACHACLPARGWSKRLRKAHTTRTPACGSAHQHLQRQAWPAPMPRMKSVSTQRRGGAEGREGVGIVLAARAPSPTTASSVPRQPSGGNRLQLEMQRRCGSAYGLHSATFQPRSSP